MDLVEKVKQAEEYSAIDAHVVYEAILMEGCNELKRPSSALAFSGIAAGLSMGFSLIAEGMLRAYLPHADWAPLVAKLGYSVGFLIVILGRQQLFTENTLTPILPLLRHKDFATLMNVLRLWSVVLIANLAGAVAFAYVVAQSGVFDESLKTAFAEIGQKAMPADFGTTLLKGIFAGWLIALLVWLLPFSETARVVVIVIMTYIVGLGGLTHVIGGSVEVLFTVASGQESWGRYLLFYLLPTLIGNTIGGVALVAVLNHAQVVSGQPRDAAA